MSATHKVARERTARALAIRDRLLPLIWRRGVLAEETDSLRVLTWRAAGFRFVLRVPINDPAEDDPEPRPCGLPAPLHFGVDVVRNAQRLLTLQWAEDETAEVLTFRRGGWEAELLAAIQPSDAPARRAA